MSVAKVTEVISSSTESIEDAVRQGVKRASKTISGIEGVWVKDTKAQVSNGEITEWRCTLKITFVVND
ncbi:dodecin domain-containing protein [Erythrobacter vulgaris]|uniref:Dodecin domain-containing protein n=1 Tax=Qipengyuania vulgaris TaxID=291985 RepID=A0A844XUZ8_9SPHN|nr:dodecin family protein [Qipengyuania vulgaris]MXO49324.1 dodecin domain-containing protein [Qipengyuania vulgaris]